MTALTRDPLLAIAKGVLWFLMGAMALGGLASLVAMPLLIIFQDETAIQIAKDAPEIPMPDFIGALLLILACVVVLLGMLFRLFQLLKRIVDTVGEGDPFVPENARRLTQMAWLSLGVQLAALPIGAIGLWIEEVTEGKGGADITVDSGLSGNGLLLMLILFILARVFRQGAAMRAELEGTV